MIPVLNEARYINECLDSVMAQDYPRIIEIIVADGGSNDGTQATVAQRAETDHRIRLLDNPGRNQAAGLNVAIRASRGEVVARLDGHAAWRPWHVRRCVELLEEWGADNVGGTMDGRGQTVLARAVARASASPFGVGGAGYRYGTRVAPRDTVFLGCFRRTALDRVGEFDEAAAPHEDYELNTRIRETGGLIIFSPEIPTTYYTRPTWRRLATQFFRYGEAKSRVARRRPAVLRPYHLVPPAAVLAAGFAAAALVSGRGRRPAKVGLLAYAVAALGASLRAGSGETASVRVLIPAVFLVIHVAWGTGFWVGLVRDRGPRRSRLKSQGDLRRPTG